MFKVVAGNLPSVVGEPTCGFLSLNGEFKWTFTAGSRVVTISPFKCNFILNASIDKHLWSMFVASSNIHESTAEVICAL